jgi:hypothetical protein
MLGHKAQELGPRDIREGARMQRLRGDLAGRARKGSHEVENLSGLTESLTLPEESRKTPRGALFSMKSTAPAGYEAVMATASKSFTASGLRSRKCSLAFKLPAWGFSLTVSSS